MTVSAASVPNAIEALTKVGKKGLAALESLHAPAAQGSATVYMKDFPPLDQHASICAVPETAVAVAVPEQSSVSRKKTA